MRIAPDGAVTVKYRTYLDCSSSQPPPCDAVSDAGISLGGQVTLQLDKVSARGNATASQGIAHVVESNDPQFPADSLRPSSWTKTSSTGGATLSADQKRSETAPAEHDSSPQAQVGGRTRLRTPANPNKMAVAPPRAGAPG